MQWAPFPQFIRANVMSQDQSLNPPSPLLISTFPPTKHSPPSSIHPSIHPPLSPYFLFPPVILSSDVTLASQGERIFASGFGRFGYFTSWTHTVWGLFCARLPGAAGVMEEDARQRFNLSLTIWRSCVPPPPSFSVSFQINRCFSYKTNGRLLKTFFLNIFYLY